AGYGSQDTGWLSYYKFFEICGLEAPKKLNGLMKIAKSAGWWWPFENAVILTERPCELNRDEDNRLHSETGMAIRYPDGWGIYSIHGVVVPEDVILAPGKQTIEQIRSE